MHPPIRNHADQPRNRNYEKDIVYVTRHNKWVLNSIGIWPALLKVCATHCIRAKGSFAETEDSRLNVLLLHLADEVLGSDGTQIEDRILYQPVVR
ncbi:hypothetical protein K0M31_017773 [Melipona bicolor]|uniref:Uncharacterized protein n=1 Tax=Melipona bicolor TaxID=60889 RepID=A0AA40KSS5_9HYME|nr:hypothetical protein K0M31_017773 [Melipona bicolor]